MIGSLPGSLQSELAKELGVQEISASSVSGGSINQSLKLETPAGRFFLKWNRSAPDDFFEKEAAGLQLLQEVDSGITIPEVISFSKPTEKHPGFLLMEFIEGASGSSEDSHQFGQELARLHNYRSDSFGLSSDNYIGSLPQSNTSHPDWISFFVEERINPQLKMAMDSGKIGNSIIKKWQNLSSRLDSIFPPAKPSLLHGDLWSGNYLFSKNGKAVLIDPAVYYGHPEMDLAFSKMFGGFSAQFYEGYQSVNRLEGNFSERVDIYNLYPLLVHVNLFGGHYIRSLDRILKNY